jgi:hypothetical protein
MLPAALGHPALSMISDVANKVVDDSARHNRSSVLPAA